MTYKKNKRKNSSHKTRNKGELLNLIKSICKNSTAKLHIVVKDFTSKIRNNVRMSASILLFNKVLVVQVSIKRQENEIKVIQMKNEELHLSLSADDMTEDMGNPKDMTE